MMLPWKLDWWERTQKRIHTIAADWNWCNNPWKETEEIWFWGLKVLLNWFVEISDNEKFVWCQSVDYQEDFTVSSGDLSEPALCSSLRKWKMDAPVCCLRGFLFTRGPTPWPSFQPILLSSSTPMDNLGHKTSFTPVYKGQLKYSLRWRGVGRGSCHLAGAISSSSSVSPGISAAWALTALAFTSVSSLRLDVNSWLVVISLGAMPCSPKS